MQSESDLPMPGALIDVVVDGEVVTGQVTRLRDPGLVVELPVAMPMTGPVQLYWTGPEGVRMVQARVVLSGAVRHGVRWQVVPEGPTERGNRRDAVRAPLRLRVQLTDRTTGRTFAGRTTDVSETGLRCAVLPTGQAPEEGAAVDVGVTLRGAVFPLPGRLHRVTPDEGGWTVIVEYTQLCDSMADLLRAQVFAALREQRRLSL